MSKRLRRTLIGSLTFCALAPFLPAQSAGYTPAMKMPKDGKQIIAVYVGGEACGACHIPEVKRAADEMKTLVAEQAKKSGASFATIGVAYDWDVKAAANFIAQNGAFDQLLLGGGWNNLGIEQFVWKDATGRAAMPQIVVVERTVNSSGARFALGEPKFLRRLVGGDEIPAWVKEGAPIAVVKP